MVWGRAKRVSTRRPAGSATTSPPVSNNPPHPAHDAQPPGAPLATGQRHARRLTIARLLLARRRVVILDEATAHLDNTSEAAVQEALL
ncbi:hypothetical protein ACFQ2K_05270 [Streptomyces sanglieri]|uniref:Uncharacterized protein n=1 Tax=Streptomyces sanglieri TaxID=193460 RepID=A0ABW2WNZ3_9ACTN